MSDDLLPSDDEAWAVYHRVVANMRKCQALTDEVVGLLIGVAGVDQTLIEIAKTDLRAGFEALLRAMRAGPL